MIDTGKINHYNIPLRGQNYFQYINKKGDCFMPDLSRFKMSQERLDALKDELYYLETVR